MSGAVVYGIRNTITNKVYVGSTFDLSRRWPHHQAQLNADMHLTGKLQRAWTQYGADVFVCEVLETVKEPLHLWACEQAWIQRLNSISNGYNHYRVVKTAQRIMPKNALPRIQLPGTSTNPFTREQSIEAFWKYVDRRGPDDCWLWTGAKANYGYGVFNRRGKLTRAHRFSYELANGPIPEGLVVRHLCHIPACVNPRHLCVGTMKDNAADMVKAGRINRTPRQWGERHWRAKLTDALVLEMFERYLAGERVTAIAEYMKIASTTVFDILMSRQWKQSPISSEMRKAAKERGKSTYTPPANISDLRQHAARVKWGPKDDLARLWSKVAKNGPLFGEKGQCWVFTGVTTTLGYGTTVWGTTSRLVHAIVYEQMIGEIPADSKIVRLCRNKLCVNPTHMVAMSHADAMRVARGLPLDTCTNGHNLSYTYIRNGRKICRMCNRDYARARRAK